MARRTWTREEIVQAFLDWEAVFGSPPSPKEWDIGWEGLYPSSSTVKYHFGSWKAGKDAAWPPKPARVSPGYWTRERIIEALQSWAREHDGLAPGHDDLSPRNQLPTPARVKREFGSVSRALHIAGLVQLTTNRRSIQKYLPLPRRSG